MKELELREEAIIPLMYIIRAEKVILDRDLAQLYQVETRALKQAARRNKARFPSDFMFELTNEEVEEMVSQNVIPSKSYFGGALPMAFTEQGIAMLSGVLNSERAIDVNIAIMRSFVHLRRWIRINDDILQKIEQIEMKFDEQFSIVFDELKKLGTSENQPRRVIGFRKIDD
jgi:RNA processing factor Prp31